MNKILPLFLALSIPAFADKKDEVEVAVVSINDFHAAFVRNDAKGVPGAAAVIETVDSLKRCYPLSVVVSAGDNFGGSYFYQATNGALMPAFFNALGIHFSALGNHAFDEGQAALAKKWEGRAEQPAGWNLTYVCANMRQLADGKIPTFAQPTGTVTLQSASGTKLNVAFAGLLTSMTPQQASLRRLTGLSFDGRYDRVLDSLTTTQPYATALNDADLRIVLSHVGTAMDATGRPCWDDRDAAHLQQVGAPQWHAAISSHTHHVVAGCVGEKQLPVVQADCYGKCVGLLVARIDTVRHEVVSVVPKVVPVHAHEPLSPAAAAMAAKIDSLLLHTRTAAGTPIGQRLTTAREDIPHDRNDNQRQTALGLLVGRAYAQAYREAAGLKAAVPVVGATHIGSIRAGLTHGPVTVLDVGETLPFANRLRVYRLDGEEVMALLRFGLQDRRFGHLQTNDLEVCRDKNGNVTRAFYLVPGTKKRVELKAGKPCYLVVDEYITTGGDGYTPSLFPDAAELKVDNLPTTTDAFIAYLKKQPNI